MPGVAYFAYGSNMDSATLRGRRGIQWSRAVPALARGWRLAVDKPSLLGTGVAMATIVPDRSAHVWGVLYEIPAADYEHLELTEGVLLGHYRRTELVVETAAAWEGPAGPAAALTLTSEERDPSLRPTTRYMQLLLAGAREHGLPEDWIAALRGIEAVEETAEMAALLPMLDLALRKPR